MRAGRLAAPQGRIAGLAYHSEHNVQIRYERTDGASFRFGGQRLFLHPIAESHFGCRCGENRRFGRRSRGHTHLVGSGGQFLRRSEHLLGWRPYRQCDGHLRRNVQPFRRDAEKDGHRCDIRQSRQFGAGDFRGFPSGNQSSFRRDDFQPGRRGAGHREVRPHSPLARRAPYRGQHVRHPDFLPSDRVGRRHRDPFDDKVHGRSCNQRRRSGSGQRQFRLDGPCR